MGIYSTKQFCFEINSPLVTEESESFQIHVKRIRVNQEALTAISHTIIKGFSIS